MSVEQTNGFLSTQYTIMDAVIVQNMYEAHIAAFRCKLCQTVEMFGETQTIRGRENDNDGATVSKRQEEMRSVARTLCFGTLCQALSSLPIPIGSHLRRRHFCCREERG